MLRALLLTTTFATSSPVELVDPLIGTDNSAEVSRGNTYPAAVWPFGMIAWTPQTNSDTRWIYRYPDRTFQGLRATHSPSIWMRDYGPFALMPLSAAGLPPFDPRARMATFRRERERTRPHEYSVELEDSGIRAEVTPGERSGLMRFTFPSMTAPHPVIVLDAFPGGSEVRVDAGAGKIVASNGSARSTTSPAFRHHFVIVFDRPIRRFGVWNGKTVTAGATSVRADRVGAFVAFDPGAVVRARVGTSFVSAEQAEINLNRELPDFDYEVARARAEAIWNGHLRRIEIGGATPAQQTTFFSAMYQVLQYPRVLHELDASGKVIHRSPYDGQLHEGPMMADTGFWDTFRAQFPLFTVTHPAKHTEVIQAMLNIYDQSGWIPKWPNPSHTNVMIGTHGDAVIGDAVVKGLRGFDLDKAYQAIRKNGTTPGDKVYAAREGLESYARLGYVPADEQKEATARTLEYAFDDFCIAQVARVLGKKEDHARFLDAARHYRNLWEPESGFMRARLANGAWVTPFDPLAWGGPYTEGNAWQYTWSVQHDVPGLIALMGGPKQFAARLDQMFSMTSDFAVGGYGKVVHEMRESRLAAMGQYAHINEPVHHVPYLYVHAGQPWKTQRWVREIMNRLYGPDPQIRLGDEDNGQMSAWYVWSAIGLYPATPCQPVYVIGSPLHPQAVVHLEGGKTFTVDAVGNLPERPYVQAARLNGKPLTRAWLTHDEVVQGGRLELRMGAQPNPRWGAQVPPPAADPGLARR